MSYTDDVTQDYSEPTSFTDDGDDLCNLFPVPAQVLAQTCFHSIICALGLVGNLLVMITYSFYKKTKSMTDVYLLHLAVADLILVIALPFIVVNEQRGWPMGFVACKLLQSAYSINLYSGTLLLACISADRYIAIVQARRSFGLRSHVVAYICPTVWVFALALTLPTLIYTKLIEERNLFTGSVTLTCQMSFDEADTAKLMKVLVPALQMAVGFLLPLLVMGICYPCIACTLLSTQSRQRHKAIRVVLAVVVVFVLCHLPYNVTLLIHTTSLFKERSCQAEKTKLLVLAVSRSIAFVHCCLNPVLYAFVGVKFRSHLKQFVTDIWCFGKQYISSVRSSQGTSDLTNDVGQSGAKTSIISNNISSFSM